MIYTVTFNPSLDYVVTVPQFQVGNINRTQAEEIFPGGKGINVSIILTHLGVSTKAMGFKAGFTGDEIERLLAQYGIPAELLPVSSGFSRINVKVRGSKETAINGQGPQVSPEDLSRLEAQLDQLTPEDMLVLSGAKPSGGADTLYWDLTAKMAAKQVPCVVDATGELLKAALPAGPFLIKPNREELEELLQRPLPTRQDLVDAALELQRLGARNVLISLGAGGALLVDAQGVVHTSAAPAGTPVNTVGAGDSMVAGFLAGYQKTQDYTYALRLGICAGSATAFAMGLATGDAIEQLMQELQ